jgi:hypothetical protein
VTLSILFTLMMLRGFYTSVRLLQVHLQQYGWAGEEADSADRSDDLATIRGKLLLRGFRLVIASLGLVVGVGGMIPGFNRSSLFGALAIITIFGIAAVLEFVNEYDFWQLRLGWPWRRR